MSRYPPTPTSAASEELKSTSEFADSLAAGMFGENGSTITWALPDGALLGSFPALIASKQVAMNLWNTFGSFNTLRSIPDDAREIVMLVTASRFGSPYEMYHHELFAIKHAGLTKEQTDSIKKGDKPKGLSEAGAVAYEASFYLANERGVMPQALYDEAVAILGEEGVLLLTHLVGILCWISVVCNMSDARLPPGAA